MISDVLARDLESGNAIHIGTRDASLVPHGGRAWAVVVAPDRERVTVFLPEEALVQILSDLESNGLAAVSLGRPRDDHAWQIKGRFEGVRPAADAERAGVEGQIGRFADNLDFIGIPRVLTQGWSPWPCHAVTLRITEVFIQTPGPGAGERLR